MDRAVVHEPGYSFQLVNIDCLPSSSNFNIIMDLQESMEELLPYMAATLPGCTYVHGTRVINFMESGHIVAIYPLQITVTDVGSPEEAAGICRTWFRRIVDVKRQKGSISPVYERRHTLSVLDIFRSLPQTNCGLCNSPSCMAFAARLFRREVAIADCEPVMRDKERYSELFRRLQAGGYRT